MCVLTLHPQLFLRCAMTLAEGGGEGSGRMEREGEGGGGGGGKGGGGDRGLESRYWAIACPELEEQGFNVRGWGALLTPKDGEEGGEGCGGAGAAAGAGAEGFIQSKRSGGGLGGLLLEEGRFIESSRDSYEGGYLHVQLGSLSGAAIVTLVRL